MIKSKGYTNEEIEAIIAEYKQSGKAITVFCKERGHKPAYQTLKGWLDAAGEAPNLPNLMVAPAIASLADVEAAYKKGIQSLITDLEKREQVLSKELDSVLKELAEAREKLTKFD